MLDTVKKAVELHHTYPDLVVGFDVMAQEDVSRTLVEYMDALLYPSLQDPPVTLPYFFHTGETGACLLVSCAFGCVRSVRSVFQGWVCFDRFYGVAALR